MDTLPLSPKAPILASDGHSRSVITPQPAGSETTQTVQAVPAVNKSEVSNPFVQEPEISTEQLAEMAEQMDKFVGSFTHELKFRVDEDSGRNVVTVIDSKSGDTIRQIPTEELLDVIARLAEVSGGLINVKV